MTQVVEIEWNEKADKPICGEKDVFENKNNSNKFLLDFQF